MLGRNALAPFLLLGTLAVAQTPDDERRVRQLIDEFRDMAKVSDSDAKSRLLADDYVHVTEDGSLTTAWRIVRGKVPAATSDRLNVRVFGGVAVASYRWRIGDADTRTSSVAQVFQKRATGWRIIATQVGGINPAISGPIGAVAIIPPKNATAATREVRETWIRQLLAADLKTPTGEHAEDLDTIRSIFAADAVYVNPDGSVLSREQVLARGHPNTIRLNSERVADAVAANTLFHVDERFAVIRDVAIWTSRNPANGDQSFRVYVKRPLVWQMVFVHHGMSVR